MLSKWRVLNDSDCKVAIVLQLRKDKHVKGALKNIKLTLWYISMSLIYPYLAVDHGFLCSSFHPLSV